MAKINAGKGLSQPSKASPPKGGKGATTPGGSQTFTTSTKPESQSFVDTWATRAQASARSSASTR
jgi:hypothetical protein